MAREVRRPQEKIRKNPNERHPIINRIRARFGHQKDSRIVLPEREQDWSHVTSGQMVAVYLIAIVFAVLIIGAVFS